MDRHDAELLLAASGGGLTLDEINPVTLRTPAAPLAAALVEKVNIDIEALLNALALPQSRVDQVLVEGVGGWLVPIRPDYFVADLAVDMKLSVLVVAQNRLGCLNHTALTVQSVVDHGLNCVGVVLNEPLLQNNMATQTNADVLRRIIGPTGSSWTNGKNRGLEAVSRNTVERQNRHNCKLILHKSLTRSQYYPGKVPWHHRC